MSIAKRVFCNADQVSFASASGDSNPIHVDPVEARRTQAGSQVVHGIHLLLWALDVFAESHPGLPPLQSIRAEFNKFVYIDEPVEVLLKQQNPASARLIIAVDGTPRAKVSIGFGEPSEECPAWASRPLDAITDPRAPIDRTLDQMDGISGRLAFPTSPEHASTLFQAAAHWLGPRRISALMASTCLVGMVSPGLHSIYSGLSVRLCAGPAPQEDSLAFRVTGTDPRFRSVIQEIAGGGLTGTIESFVRTPPVQQPIMESLEGLVNPSEFAGSVALVVGGSRGLGELTAKLIATGGGRVVITWNTGGNDAERVAREIRAAGYACEILRYDARKPAAEQLASLPDAPTHAYYFATPPIARPQSEVFSEERLQQFLAVYVEGFWQMVQALRARQPSLSVFYPSSVFVTDRPKGMTEYSMAKAAGELLCADINASLSPLRVTVKRLPRLPTDQTSSITVVETADPLETLLPIIREVQL